MGKDSVSEYNWCASSPASWMLQLHGHAANMVVSTPASYEPGDRANLVFKLINPGVELPSCSASEDSDEIDALLYSDSEEEEASTGNSPTEEVASSLAVPGKRKRVDVSNNLSSMVDTASSSGAYYQSMVREEAAESSCEGGEGQCEEDDEAGERKRVKREMIEETVELLRRIIPGGHGKDAAAVIDDAISYLESLKLQLTTLCGYCNHV